MYISPLPIQSSIDYTAGIAGPSHPNTRRQRDSRKYHRFQSPTPTGIHTPFHGLKSCDREYHDQTQWPFPPNIKCLQILYREGGFGHQTNTADCPPRFRGEISAQISVSSVSWRVISCVYAPMVVHSLDVVFTYYDRIAAMEESRRLDDHPVTLFVKNMKIFVSHRPFQGPKLITKIR